MPRIWRAIRVVVIVSWTLGLLLGGRVLHSEAAASPHVIAGDTPDVVTHLKAALLAVHSPTDLLQINVGLGAHNSAALDRAIAAAATSGSSKSGKYLTTAQYMATYAPTSAEVQAVQNWASSQGLTVLRVGPENLMVDLQGTVQQVDRAFAVAINDYSVNGRSFYSNDRDPTVPGDLNVRWVTGLNNYYRATALSHPMNLPAGGYTPANFQQAYDMGSSPSGSGQGLGFTLWGAPLQQSDLTAYANHTGSRALSIRCNTCLALTDSVAFIPVDGTSVDQSTWVETAMDAEVAHGIAPGSVLSYWLSTDSQQTHLEDTVAQAASSSIKVFSNSWSFLGLSMDPTMDGYLQSAASQGKTFYFSSGDNGTVNNPSYPADSAYVVSVGGTTLNTDSSGNWQSETTWDNVGQNANGAGASGGGCTTDVARPVWQVGVGAATCSGRAFPDVAADGNPNTGAFVFESGAPTPTPIGGTSLAAPIWAGMSLVWNRYLSQSGPQGLGFAAPLLYHLANNPGTYASDFHDITQANPPQVVYAPGPGWDQVTGWGSPDLSRLEQQVTTTTSVTSNLNPSIISQQVTYTSTVNPIPSGGTVDFQDGGTDISGCNAQPVDPGSGTATCSTSYSGTGTHAISAAYSGTIFYHGSTSSSLTQTVSGQSTSTTLTSSPPANNGTLSVPPGSSVTYSAQVSPVPSGGTVDFQVNGGDIAGCNAQPVDTSGIATCTLNYPTYVGQPSPGSGAYTATFGGSNPYAGSTSNTETVYAHTQLLGNFVSVPAGNGEVGSTVQVTGTEWYPGVETINLYWDSTSGPLLTTTQTDSSGNFSTSITVPQSSLGPHEIVAVSETYGGQGQAAIAVQVQTATHVTSSSSPSITGQQVTYTASVSPVPNGGNIRFMDGSTAICNDPPINSTGQETCKVTYTSTGTHSITASFQGVPQYYVGSTSSVLTQTVRAATAALNLASTTGTVGSTTSVTGSNFAPNHTVNVYWNSTSTTPIATTTSSSTGTISTSIKIPAGTNGTNPVLDSDGTHAGTHLFTVKTSLTLSSVKGYEGELLKISGKGFTAFEGVALTWNTSGGSPIGTLVKTTADSTGTFSTTALVPPGTPGKYLITGSDDVGTTGASTSTAFTHIPHLTISPTSGLPGSKAHVSGTGFATGQAVTIKWNCSSAACTATSLGTSAATDANGDFGGVSSTHSVTVTIPSAGAASYPVGGTDTSGDFARATFTVT